MTTTTANNNNSNNHTKDDVNVVDEQAVVRCGTTKGDMTWRLYRQWSPAGYDRAVKLLEQKFYDHSHFFRVVPHFLVQFGISYSLDNKKLMAFSRQTIPDDPQLDPPIPFERGTISYAGSGENSRTSQLFISYGPSKTLGTQRWETPIGRVEQGMDDVVDHFFSYGDMPPWGKGPVQGKIHAGPEYIEQEFPKTDRFTTCTVERFSKSGKKINNNNNENSSMSSTIQRIGTSLTGSSSNEGLYLLGVAGSAFAIVLVVWLSFVRKLSQQKTSKSF